MSIEATCYSETSPAHAVNEDLVVVGQDFVVVLDGASPVPGLDTGCVHDVPWLVRRLGTHLVAGLLDGPTAGLATVLERAITALRRDHESSCDLRNPHSPSSTVAILRRTGDRLEHLVLADSPIVLRRADGQVTAVSDDRLDHLFDYSLDGVAAARNAAGGFWVASTSPEAAHQAVTGAHDLAEVDLAAVLTDGAATLIERHGRLWADLLALLESAGPRALVEATRRADADGPEPRRAKRHDDATAVVCRFPAME